MICFENVVEASEKKMKQWIDTDSKGLALSDNTDFVRIFFILV